MPYRFGGRNRLEGFDCSQFVTELMISQGLVPHGTDLSAQGLFDHFLPLNLKNTILPGPGAIAFYGKNADSISHVAFCLTAETIIEAGGGDHTTVELASAIARSACVRERPIKYRKDFFCALTPVYDRNS